MDEKEFEMAEQSQRAAIEQAISDARNAARMPSTGFCFNCGDEVANARNFCDKDCAEDYEYRRRRSQV